MDSEYGQAIRARLIEARKQAKFTQAEVADRLSISRQSVSKWEVGKGSPNPRELADLCALYGVSSDWILKGIASKADTGCALVDKVLNAARANTAEPKDTEESR